MKLPENYLLAYELYLKSPVLTNKDLRALFNVTSGATIAKIKKDVLLKMAERNIYLPNGKLATIVAFEVWGLDEKTLEHKYSKAKRYNIS